LPASKWRSRPGFHRDHDPSPSRASPGRVSLGCRRRSHVSRVDPGGSIDMKMSG
jgi:hypothetical protein